MQFHKTFDDSQLINLMQTGDHAAFAELYRRYWKSMYNKAYKRLKNSDISQDVVQNVFTDLWERKEKLHIENIPAYLHTAIRFQVLKQSVNTPDLVTIADLFETEIVSTGRTDDTLRHNEIQELLRLWIEALPKKRREIFVLHYLRGKSTNEIADSLQISLKTVQNQLNTATTTIKAHFGKLLLLQFASLFPLF